jgi:outer membrane PBP1 activator LpoA protein
MIARSDASRPGPVTSLLRTLLPIVLLSIVLSLAACASGGGSRAPIDDSQVRALLDAGEFRAAGAAFEQLARRNRRSREGLLLEAAEAYREEGDYAEVARITATIKGRQLDPGQLARLDLLLAEAALDAGDAARALDLATLPSAELERSIRARGASVRARALDALARPWDALSERVVLLELVPDSERAGVEGEILETLAAREGNELNRQLGALDANDARRPWLERAVRLTGAIPVRALPRPTRAAGALIPGAPGAGPGSAWVPEGFASTGRVALLLPLSGPLAAAGGAIRDGFLAAYFDADRERPELRIYDVGETPETALAAYQSAVSDGNARVVGPLAREQVAALFDSGPLPIPLLALNHPESGKVPPRGSQQYGLLPDDEGALAAESAALRGLRRASIMVAAEEWSERAALAFRAQFEQAGGAVVGEARLAGDAVDFSATIADALGDASADVIFVAVRPAQGRLLLPQLRARGLDTRPILATSHIYSGNSNRALDRDLNGVEFSDAPWLFGLAPGMPAREALAATLPNAAQAPRLFAFGIDAFRMLPYLDWLSTNTDAYLPGASGQLALDGFGRVRRLPVWMRIVDGLPQPVEGALAPEARLQP